MEKSEKSTPNEEKTKNSENTEDKNPYSLCIWNSEESCQDCANNTKLNCHFKQKDSVYFLLGVFCAWIPAVIGILISELSLLTKILSLVIWVAYMAFFFLFIENRILCNHCPYYGEGGKKTLSCYANYGLLKTYKYKPEPISKFEQILFVGALIIFFGYPLPFELVGKSYILLGISIVGIIIALSILSIRNCGRCVNFSCPLNRVPKKIVDEFLKLNPVIREAWEKSGYKLDE